MKIRFKCGSCGKTHEVDAANAGRRGKCSGCGASMVVPAAPAPAPARFDDEDDPGDAYGLAGPDPDPEPDSGAASAPVSTFAPAASVRPREAVSSFHRVSDDASSRPRRTRSKPVDDGGDPAEAILRRMPIILGLTGIVMIVLAVAVPSGMKYAGGLASGLGLILTMSTFLVGAYGAFKEDSLYGFLYLIIPLFTAYYIVSRFEDLRNWVYLGLIGLFLSMVGGAMLAVGGG